MKQYITSQPKEIWEKILSSQVSLLRRVIFSRSLRLLPLVEQVGAVEALSFVMKEANSVFPLSDQHLLAFLSELLKMCSVADGEMSDAALAGYVVDKNGYAMTAKKPNTPNADRHPSHASTIFFRRECILKIGDWNFIVPEELPHGVQIRVSSISLLRSVITGHADAFFDAAVSTPIGKV
jgi:transformation/transcription domain-associated protein